MAALGVAFLALTAADKPAPSPQEVIDAAPASAWKDIPAEDLVLIRFKDGSSSVLQLAPAFAPVHVANIKTLVKTGWLNSAALIRVQDNYVTQWGYPDAEEAPLPAGVVKVPPAEYDHAPSKAFKPLPYKDSFSRAGHVATWPAATDGKRQWLVHCYGMIGVARDVAPDTGSGSQLYTVIGQAPRALDRNVTLVGRVVAGMENLSARPRGTEELGFYKAPPEAGRFTSVTLVSDLPASERPKFQVMDTDSATFADWVKARANRSGTFFVKSAGAIDICNATAPIRPKP
ncbi:MAG: peptidylprolyl isomerase [Asticcacaulis sp. 32-58-5]|nr:MAG: peptidylprolyl isomerase [Asticcacaulis sp. 32-58-5]